MAKFRDMDVSLVFPDAQTVQNNYRGLIYLAARTCYSEKTPHDIWNDFIEGKLKAEKVLSLIDHVINSGHHSTIEHINFTFAISGVSRALTHQLVRHRIGVAYDQQSQRYLTFGGKNVEDDDETESAKSHKYSKPVTNEQEQRVYREYKKGATLGKLAKKYLTDTKEILLIIEKNTTTAPDYPIQTSIPLHYFKDINTPNRARFLGYVLTSNATIENYYEDNDSLKIMVYKANSNALYHFAEEIGLSERMISVDSQQYIKMIIVSSELVKFYRERYGIGAPEGFKVSSLLENVPSEFHSDLLLGLLEASGNVNDIGSVNFSLQQSLRDFAVCNIRKLTGIEPNEPSKLANPSALSYHGYENLTKLFLLLYQNANPMQVSRWVYKTACQLSSELDQRRAELMKQIASDEYNAVLPDSIADDLNASFTAMDNFSADMKTYRELLKAGIPAEDARFVFPNAAKTNIIMTVNLRSLIHISGLRLCTMAQWEIRKLFKLIRKEIMSVDPLFGKLLVPKCVPMGYCDEKRNEDGHCPIRPPMKTVFQVYDDFKAGKIVKKD